VADVTKHVRDDDRSQASEAQGEQDITPESDLRSRAFTHAWTISWRASTGSKRSSTITKRVSGGSKSSLRRSGGGE